MGRPGIPVIGSRRGWKPLAPSIVLAAVLLASCQGRRSIDPTPERAGRAVGLGHAATGPGSLRSGSVALARLGPAGGLISVGARPGLRVDAILVKVGDQVSRGTVLAILEGHSVAQRQFDQAKARRTLADRQRRVRLVAARKAAETAKARRDEAAELYKQFIGTLKGKERYDAELALHQVEMQALKTDLDLQLLEAGNRAESPKDGSPGREGGLEAEILDAQVALAEAGLKEAEVRAPGPGRVLRVLVHPGELSAGTVLEMGDVSSMIATAEVDQNEIPRIRLGDPAVVDVLGHLVPGKVARIGSMVGKNRLTSVDPRALRDLRVVEVTIQLDEPNTAAPYVNMEVETTISPAGASPISTATGEVR